jgi:hypothetical protein
MPRLNCAAFKHRPVKIAVACRAVHVHWYSAATAELIPTATRTFKLSQSKMVSAETMQELMSKPGRPASSPLRSAVS